MNLANRTVNKAPLTPLLPLHHTLGRVLNLLPHVSSFTASYVMKDRTLTDDKDITTLVPFTKCGLVVLIGV
jgi:hypothetical protein